MKVLTDFDNGNVELDVDWNNSANGSISNSKWEAYRFSFGQGAFADVNTRFNLSKSDAPIEIDWNPSVFTEGLQWETALLFCCSQGYVEFDSETDSSPSDFDAYGISYVDLSDEHGDRARLWRYDSGDRNFLDVSYDWPGGSGTTTIDWDDSGVTVDLHGSGTLTSDDTTYSSGYIGLGSGRPYTVDEIRASDFTADKPGAPSNFTASK